MKDPAFLFYSQDFYLGTRTLKPIERAAYIDLLIFQHQYHIIPDDLERLSLFCNGIPEAVLQGVLEAKFKLTEKGWINLKMNEVIDERQSFKDKKSISGKIGQFLKKVKAQFTESKYLEIREMCKKIDNEIIAEIIEKHSDINEIIKGLFKHTLNTPKNKNGVMLKGMFKHIEDEDEDENENENEDENENLKKNIKGVPNLKSTTLLHQCINELINNHEYIWYHDETVHMESLIRKIKKAIQDRKRKEGHISWGATDNEVFEAFRTVIENLPDWVRENKYSIEYISKKFNEIAQSIKSKSQKNGITESTREILDGIR